MQRNIAPAQHSPSRLWPNGARRLMGLLARGAAELAAWRERAGQRRALDRLDDRLLRDIGLSPEQARSEACRRPWQA